MAAHSSDHVWRIPGTVEPGGLLCMGSHRVRHDWSDLAAAAAAVSSLYTRSSSPLMVWQATVWGRNYCHIHYLATRGLLDLWWIAISRRVSFFICADWGIIGWIWPLGYGDVEGIVARLLVLGPPFGQLHSPCCLPLLTLRSSLDELYGESLPRFLEAILLQYD